MALARHALLGLGTTAYLIVLAGVVLERLPVATLLRDPPIASLVAATGCFVLFSLLVGRLLD